MEEKPNLKLIFRILKWICPAHLYEEIEGDLIQRYNGDLKLSDRRNKSTEDRIASAKRRLILNAICFFRPGILFRHRWKTDFNFIHMLQSYFKFSWRHLLKSKTFSLLNVTGLAVGIASFLTIMLYVDFEMRFDQFYTNKNEIYRVAYRQTRNGEVINEAAKNFLGLGYWMKNQFPEVEAYTLFWKIPANAKFLLYHNGKLFNEPGSRIVADSTFFNVFPSLLVKGRAETALKDAHSLIVSERIAAKIFGAENPIGKIIAASEYNQQYEITGVIKNTHENSHLVADFIVLHDYRADEGKDRWEGPWRYTYVTLHNGVDAALFEHKLNDTFHAMPAQSARLKEVSLSLQPLTDIHLTSNYKDEIAPNGSLTLVQIMVIIACVILILAWINYLNLETSRFVTRAKEVGVRRIVGSTKTDLICQFVVEFFCVNAIAIVVAFGILGLGLPYIGVYTGMPFDQVHLFQPRILVSVLALFVTGLLLIGAYPAVLLSRIKLATTLKGKFTNEVKQGASRKIFLTFQFVSSMVLIAFVIVVYTQLEFMRTSNKKIEIEQVISILNPTVYSSQEENNVGEGGLANFTNFKNKLLQNSAVASVSSSSAIPGEAIGFTYVNLIKRNVADPYDPTSYKLLFIDYNFIDLFGLQLMAGRNYSPHNGEDEAWSTLVLNESAIKALDFKSPEDAIGEQIHFMVNDNWVKYKIIGVLADYHHQALKSNILPTIFFLNHNRGQQVYYSIKLNAGVQPREALVNIERAWKEIFPEKPFEYFFLDEYYDQQFKSEVHFGRIFTLFSGIAGFIACLGIFGMTLFELKAKVKEISIRKILGASATNVVVMFSRKNFRVVLISASIASPIIYYAASKWLSSYPIKVDVSPLFFLIPISAVFIVVAIISSIQVMRAAHLNPVDNLRHE
jgi:putative ABC transport system permease protein